MTLKDGTTLTNKQRIASLCGIFASVFAWGISFAGLTPLMSLSLENQGYSTLMIGYIAAVTPIGVILAAPLVAGVIRQFGTVGSIFITSFAGLITVALLPVYDSYEGWLGLRFLAGLFGAVPWIATETWLNAIATDKTRGRVTALYGTVMAASFALGPMMLSVIGTQGYTAYYFYIGVMAISLLPLIFVWKLAPVLHLPKGVKFSGFIYTIPSILAAALVCGMVDMSFFSFLPIWGLRVGFEEETAILLLSIFVLGNFFMQLPIGWLADHVDRYLVLIGCGVVGVIGPIALMFFATSTTSIGIVLFLWGGCTWALYTVSLAILGERYKGGSLTAASAVFVIAYEVANIAGPPIAGIAIEVWEPQGLMGFVLVCTSLFVIFTSIRQFYKRHHSINPDEHQTPSPRPLDPSP